VFINDLPDCVDSDVFMFADTKLYRTVAHQSDIQTVQNDINHLFNWSEKWLLRFHPDKCKVLPITTKRFQIHPAYLRCGRTRALNSKQKVLKP
jgi:hypothetical protein